MACYSVVEILRLDTSAGLVKLEEILRTRQGFRISSANIGTALFTSIYTIERREILNSSLFVMFTDTNALKVKK